MATLQDWLSRLEKVRKSGKGYKALCPAHLDRNPSLTITEGDNGKVLVYCHADCAFEDIRKAAGLEPDNTSFPGLAKQQRQREPKPKKDPEPPPEPEPLPSGNNITVYHYYYADGSVAYAAVRRDYGGGRKSFSQWTPAPNTDGLWVKVGLPDNRPIYRLKSILESKGKVAIVEGEKCVQACAVAWPHQPVTCWGGGSNTWHLTDWEPLRGREVSLVADADPLNKKGESAGHKAMLGLAAHLAGMGCQVKLALPPVEWDNDIADWLDEGVEKAGQTVAALLKDFVLPGDTSSEPPLELEMEPTPPLDPSGLVQNKHYRILGLVGDQVAVRLSVGRILQRSREALTQPATLIAIAPLSWWHDVTESPLTTPISRALGDAMIREADKLGQIDLTQVYGRGAARLSNGHIVYHLGDRLLIDGKEEPLDSDGHTWLAEPRIEMTAPATPAQIKLVAEAVLRYRWASPSDGKRLLGWLVVAIAGGALEWRPHIQFSAPSGTGKSWILREVVQRLMGPLLQRIADATPAALARLTAHGSLPISIDEAEPSSEWVLDLFAMLRIASGAEGQRIRADNSAAGVQVQAPRFCALLSSVATPRLSRADSSRLSSVRLGPEVENWTEIGEAIKEAMKLADGIRAAIILATPRIAQRASELTFELQEQGMDSREALTVAALTAGWHWWGIDESDVYSKGIDDDDDGSEATDCILAILAITVRQPGSSDKSIARAMEYDEESIKDLYGIIYDDRGLLIAYGHPGLGSALRGTPWSQVNLRGALLQLKGTVLTENAIRVGTRRLRAVQIPPDVLERIGLDLRLPSLGE